MKIRVNQNIDNYRPDVFHGLDFSQTMHALGCVIAGSGAFLFAAIYLHLPQTVCFYIAMAFAFPVSAAGFVKIGAMTVAEYLKKRREILRMPVYYYCPEALGRDYLLEGRKEASEDSGPKNRKAKRRQSERLFLDEMNSTSEDNPVGGEE